jgi:DNA-binding CsgD family transcriptional regulator/tetratricopeptide (TPR) repeat protein
MSGYAPGMAASFLQATWPSPPELRDREIERKVLDQLVSSLRSGESGALVLHGEPGIGKTALLDYLAKHAQGCLVARTQGVPTEMELPFAGVHQLCVSMLDRLDGIPEPQSDALRTAFGLSAGPPSDQFLVALGVLSLLSEVAAEQPLVCIIDDYQWLDFASAVVLSFTSRRLDAESLGVVIATRVITEHLAGLPELAVNGLPDSDAYALLDSVLSTKVDSRVRDQIVAETRGNPLALLELPRALIATDPAVGFELPRSMPLENTIEESFRQRLLSVPSETRRLLLVAAAEPTGDPLLVWRAAERIGISREAAEPAADAGIAEFSTLVQFRHPLARSAAYRSGSAEDRRAVHQALAEATDPELHLERRAWHRAQAADGPDEDVAAELERAAELALARGCFAAAGTYLHRATNLTNDPAQRVGRALVAAKGKILLGAFPEVVKLLALAESGPLTEMEKVQADLVRAQLALMTTRGSDATPRLLAAAKRLEKIDWKLSRATYLDALSSAVFVGRLANAGAGFLDVARLATAPADDPHPSGPLDSLLEGLATIGTKGYLFGAPILRSALSSFGRDMSPDEEFRWLWCAIVAAMRMWDDDGWDRLSERYVQLARESGALSELPLALLGRTYVLLFSGDLAAASSLSDETRAVNEAIGSNLAPYGAFGLTALRGDEAETLDLVESTIKEVTRRGEGVGVTFANWAVALLHNGLGNYDKALAAAKEAIAYDGDIGSNIWPSVELIEAATRVGENETARAVFSELSDMMTAADTNWALGLRARCQALLSEDDRAEEHYGEAIRLLGVTRMSTDLARAHLVYGEWLRRQRRSIDSREQLRTAYRMFEAMGLDAFADRARRELHAAGEGVRKRVSAMAKADLTAQEAQIARLASDGLSNPEIATRLFISSHTVHYHLRKVFAKLGISSRSQLPQGLGLGKQIPQASE